MMRTPADDATMSFPKPASWRPICKSFLPGEHDAVWPHGAFHGWEVLQFEVPGYDTERVRGQRDHNVRNIARVVYDLMTDSEGDPEVVAS